MTRLESLMSTQVMADMVEQKYVENIVFSPLAVVDKTLVGVPGDTIKLPRFQYIGDAAGVEEGEDIDVKMLSASAVDVTIKKVANGAAITDEAILSGYGDPLSELATQLAKTIAKKVDSDCMAALAGIPEEMTERAGKALSAVVIADALVRFGENLDGDKVLLISPKQLATLRKDKDYVNAGDLSTEMLMSGAIGMIWGCQIVVSNKITEKFGSYTNYIVKPGALAIYLKNDTFVEQARHAQNQTTDIFVSKMYAAYLYDESKAVKLITEA